MSEQTVSEYVDANGNTFQLSEAHAELLGYTKVGAKAARENKVIDASDAEAVGQEPKRSRRVTTK